MRTQKVRRSLSSYGSLVIGMVRARKRLESEPAMEKQDLYSRILKACAEIGIEDVEIVETGQKGMDSGWYRGPGYVRSRPLHKTPRGSECKVGYIERDSHTGGITKRSFSVDYTDFSDEKAKAFRQALVHNGIEPQVYHPICPPILYTEHELAWEKVRNQQAPYR